MTANCPVLDVMARETKYVIGSPIGRRRALNALPHGRSTISPWCRHRSGAVQSFLNIDICRCFVFCRPDQFSPSSYVGDNSCLIRE
jgi:hypothetical protein